MPFIEAYSFCLSEALKIKKRENYKSVLNSIINSAKKKSSEFHYEEAINKNKFDNCLKMLSDIGVLNKEYEGKNKYISISDKEKLMEMNEELRKFLVFN